MFQCGSVFLGFQEDQLSQPSILPQNHNPTGFLEMRARRQISRHYFSFDGQMTVK